MIEFFAGKDFFKFKSHLGLCLEVQIYGLY